MGCPRREQRVSTRDTQLNSIPAYHLCSCGYSRSLLRRSSLLYGMYACVDTLTHCTSSTSTQSNASGGGAPCVTAGDARRANPWRSGEGSFRHRRCRTAPTLVTPSTLAVRRRRRRKLVGLLIPRVHPRSTRASPAVKHGAPPPEA